MATSLSPFFKTLHHYIKRILQNSSIEGSSFLGFKGRGDGSLFGSGERESELTTQFFGEMDVAKKGSGKMT